VGFAIRAYLTRSLASSWLRVKGGREGGREKTTLWEKGERS